MSARRASRAGLASVAVLLVSATVVASACTPGEGPATSAPSAQTAASVAPAAPKPSAEAGQKFGKALDLDTPFVELKTILADPKAYDGKRVRTRGEVIAVCQAAGCWADLKPEGAASDPKVLPTHVSMHDHAFFLPKNAKTKVAEIEGNLAVKALSQSEVDHYNGEGASLTAGTPIVQVDALGVILR